MFDGLRPDVRGKIIVDFKNNMKNIYNVLIGIVVVAVIVLIGFGLYNYFEKPSSQSAQFTSGTTIDSFTVANGSFVVSGRSLSRVSICGVAVSTTGTTTDESNCALSGD